MVRATGSYSFNQFLGRTKTAEKKALIDAAQQYFGKEWDWIRRVVGRKRQPTLVDFGSGTGDGARQLATGLQHARVLALEPCLALHKNACKRHRGIPNLTMQLIEPGHLGRGEPNWIDLLSIRLVLQHVPKPKELLEESFHALAPGGGLIIFDSYVRPMDFYPRDTQLSRTWKKILAARARQGGDPDIGIKLPSMLSDIGFEKVEISNSGGGLQLATEENMGYFLDRWTYILSHVERRKCRAALKAYLKRPGACYSVPSFSTFLARKPR